MSAASRGGSGAVSALLRNSRRVCSQCARSTPATPTPSLLPRYGPAIARRPYSETAAAIAAAIAAPDDVPLPSSRYRIKAGLILSRPPLLTRAPTPFEEAFYLYQKRLNERLAVPFRAALYFPKDTARDLDWRLKARERHGVAAKDIGRYNPRGRVAWNDEVLTGSATSTQAYMVERLLADAEVRVSEDGEEIAAEERTPVERPMPRRSVADEEGDVRRLDRRMDETLYLVVRRGEGEEATWMFPAGDVMTSEALHETAKRTLAESAGVNMNTWIVGCVPIAHHVTMFEDTPATENEDAPVMENEDAPAAKGANTPAVKSEETPAAKNADTPATESEGASDESEDASDESRFDGEKIFFLKGRIMAGQVDLTGNKYGYTDFKWVNKDELRETLPKEYWWSVRKMVELR